MAIFARRMLAVAITLGIAFGDFASAARSAAVAISPIPVLIYGDAMAVGWQDWSWGQTARDFDATTSVRSGTRSTRMHLRAPGDGLQFGRNDAVSISGLNALRIWAQGNPTSTNTIFIEVANGAQTLVRHGPLTLPPGMPWTQSDVMLPAAASQASAVKIFDGAGSAGTPIFIDDIAFVADGVATPPGQVYSENLQNGWQDWSWGNPTRNLVDTTQFNTGARSIRIQFTTSDGGFQLGRQQAFDANGYGILRFWVKGGEGSANRIRIELASSQTTVASTLPMTVPASSNWMRQDVVIPTTLGPLTTIKFANDGVALPGSFYIDDIEFLTASATATVTATATATAGPPTSTPAPPTATPLPPTTTPSATSASALIYGEGFGDGWQDWSWGETVRNFSSVTPTHTGAVAVSVEYVQPYGGLQFGRADMVSTTGYSDVSLWVKGGSLAENRIIVELGVDEAILTRTIPVTIPANSDWREIRVSLPATTTVINRVKLINDNVLGAGAFYVDDVELVRNEVEDLIVFNRGNFDVTGLQAELDIATGVVSATWQAVPGAAFYNVKYGVDAQNLNHLVTVSNAVTLNSGDGLSSTVRLSVIAIRPDGVSRESDPVVIQPVTAVARTGSAKFAQLALSEDECNRRLIERSRRVSSGTRASVVTVRNELPATCLNILADQMQAFSGRERFACEAIFSSVFSSPINFLSRKLVANGLIRFAGSGLAGATVRTSLDQASDSRVTNPDIYMPNLNAFCALMRDSVDTQSGALALRNVADTCGAGGRAAYTIVARFDPYGNVGPSLTGGLRNFLVKDVTCVQSRQVLHINRDGTIVYEDGSVQRLDPQNLATAILNLNLSVAPLTWDGTKAIAHRGDRVSSPDNTLAAIDRAIQKGAPQMELDFQLSKTGVPIMAHGSVYQDGRKSLVVGLATNSVTTKVYGPTQPCYSMNIEDSEPSSYENCDVGTWMSMASEGSSRTPKFKNERYVSLDTVLQQHPDYCGWMIELKNSESELTGRPRELIDAEIARLRPRYIGLPTGEMKLLEIRKALEKSAIKQRNAALGREVQRRLQSAGLIERCQGQLWVTSFEDSALAGITDDRILKLRVVSGGQLSSFNQDIPEQFLKDWRQKIGFWLSLGYDGIAVDLKQANDVVEGEWLTDYARRQGLRVVAYTTNWPAPFTDLTNQTPENNQTARDVRLDYFLTDILDDMLVRTRATPPFSYTRYSTTFGYQLSAIVVRNHEVYPIEGEFIVGDSSGNQFANKLFETPGDGWFVIEPRNLHGTSALPQVRNTRVELYGDQSYTANFKTTKSDVVLLGSGALFRQSVINNSARAVITEVRHVNFDYVQPRISYGRDRALLKVKGVYLPSVDGSNIVRIDRETKNACRPDAGPEQQITAAFQPAVGWKIRNGSDIKVKLDGTDVGSIESELRTRLSPGSHTLSLEALVYQDMEANPRKDIQDIPRQQTFSVDFTIEEQSGPPGAGQCAPPPNGEFGDDPPPGQQPGAGPNPGNGGPNTPDDWTMGWGDPHLTSADGIKFDNHALGEFIYLRPISTTQRPGFEIQARHKLWNSGGGPAIISAIAVRAGKRVFQFEPGKPVLVDGQAITITSSLLDGDVQLHRVSDNTYRLIYGDETLRIEWEGNYINLSGGIRRDNGYHGLLGTPNGNPADDFARPDGSALAVDMQVELAAAWAVTRSNSLFTYEPGRGPESYFIPNTFVRPSPAALEPFAQQVIDEINSSTCAYAGASLGDSFVQSAAIDLYFGMPRQSFLSAACTYQVSGMLSDERDTSLRAVGYGVSMSAPGLTPCTTRSDRSGRFSCTMTPLANMGNTSAPEVSINIEGLQPMVRSFPRRANVGETLVITDVSVLLPVKTVDVSGRLTRANNSAAANVQVTVQRTGGTDVLTTDSNGRYATRFSLPADASSADGIVVIRYNDIYFSRKFSTSVASGQIVTTTADFAQLDNLGLVRFTGRITNTAVNGVAISGVAVEIRSPGIEGGACFTVLDQSGEYTCVRRAITDQAISGNMILRGIVASEVYTTPLSIAAAEMPVGGTTLVKQIDASGSFRAKTVRIRASLTNVLIPGNGYFSSDYSGSSIQVYAENYGVLCSEAGLDCTVKTAISGPVNLIIDITDGWGSVRHYTRTQFAATGDTYLYETVPVTPTTLLVTGRVTQFGTLPMPSPYVAIRGNDGSSDILDVPWSSSGVDASGNYTHYVVLKQGVVSTTLSTFIDYDSFYERSPSPEATSFTRVVTGIRANQLTPVTQDYNFGQRTVQFIAYRAKNGNIPDTVYSAGLRADDLELRASGQVLCASTRDPNYSGLSCTLLLTSAAPIQATITLSGAWGSTTQPFVIDPLQIPGTAAVDGTTITATAYPTMVRLTGRLMRNGQPVQTGDLELRDDGGIAVYDSGSGRFLDRAGYDGSLDAWIVIRPGVTSGDIKLTADPSFVPYDFDDTPITLSLSNLVPGQVNTYSQDIIVP